MFFFLSRRQTNKQTDVWMWCLQKSLNDWWDANKWQPTWNGRVVDLPESTAWETAWWDTVAISCRWFGSRVTVVAGLSWFWFGHFGRLRCDGHFLFGLFNQYIWIYSVHAEIQIRRILLIVLRPGAIHFDLRFAKDVRVATAWWFQDTAWAAITAHTNIKRCWRHDSSLFTAFCWDFRKKWVI